MPNWDAINAIAGAAASSSNEPTARTPLPEGEYLLLIDEAEMKAGRDNPEIQGLNLHFSVQGPTHNGFGFWTTIYVVLPDNPEREAKNVKKAARMYLYTGVPIQWPDVSGLLGKEVGAKVTIWEKNNGKVENSIAYFMRADEVAGQAAPAPAPAKPTRHGATVAHRHVSSGAPAAQPADMDDEPPF